MNKPLTPDIKEMHDKVDTALRPLLEEYGKRFHANCAVCGEAFDDLTFGVITIGGGWWREAWDGLRGFQSYFYCGPCAAARIVDENIEIRPKEPIVE